MNKGLAIRLVSENSITHRKLHRTYMREVKNMTQYNVFVAGSILRRNLNKEEAEKILEEARKSYLAWVHPYDAFYIKPIEKER